MGKYRLIFFIFINIILSTGYSLTDDSGHHVKNRYIKGDTSQLLKEYLFSAKKISATLPRPELDSSVVSSESHFRVHYDTSGFHAPDMTDTDRNGIPDYVDSALVYLEYAWDLDMNQLGYNPPLSEARMKVKVRLVSGMRKFAPSSEAGSGDFELQLTENATVRTVLEQLKIPDERPKTVLVNRLHAGLDTA